MHPCARSFILDSTDSNPSLVSPMYDVQGGDSVKAGLWTLDWTGPWIGLWTGIWTHSFSRVAPTRSSVGARKNTGEPIAAASKLPKASLYSLGLSVQWWKFMGAGTIAPKLRLGGLDVPGISHQHLSYAGNVTHQ